MPRSYRHISYYEREIVELKEQGLTLKEIGEKLGLKKSPLTDWKNNKSKPTIDQIKTICEIFAVSADYILFGKDANENLTKEESEVIQAYKKADARTQEIVKLSLQPYMPQETKLSDLQIG